MLEGEGVYGDSTQQQQHVRGRLVAQTSIEKLGLGGEGEYPGTFM